MKIAIIGAGFAGLSAAYFLQNDFSVTVFDPDYRKSASYISTGLMHPYPGKFPRRSKDASVAMGESLSLMREIQDNTDILFFEEKGIFRPALFPSQEKIFRKLSEKHDDVEFWQDAHEKIPGLAKLSGMFIKSGVHVHSPTYISALLSRCTNKGVLFIFEKVAQEMLSDFDVVVICAGNFLDLEPIKGQMLVVRTEEQIPFPLCGIGHITPFSSELWIGSTYERNFTSLDSDEKGDALLDQVAKFYPSLQKKEILSRRAGVRFSQKSSYLPYLRRMNDRTWAFSGLGSRGLLYHALFAKKLHESIRTSLL